MEVKINIDEKMLRGFGLGNLVNQFKQINPIVAKQMMQGFQGGAQRQMRRMQPLPVRKPFDMERTNNLVMINLKQDVRDILESKSREDIINFILSRLGMDSLLRLVD